MPLGPELNPTTTSVFALYPDGWEAFALAEGTTFSALARTLEDLECAHDGAATSVKITFTLKPSRHAGRLQSRPNPGFNIDHLGETGAEFRNLSEPLLPGLKRE